MSAVKAPVRLPLLPISLAALLLVLSTCLLLYTFFVKTAAADRQQSSIELSDTLVQLSIVTATSSEEWVQSDQLAKLIASADVQVDDLVDSNEGLSGVLSSDENRDAARQVSADWRLLREGLLSFNQTVTNQTSQPVVATQIEPATQLAGETQAVETTSQDTAVKIPASVLARVMGVATDFEAIRARVTEGTRVRPLIDLVNSTSDTWARASSASLDALHSIIVQQNANADELLRLSQVGTGESLYGYYTSNQISDYVQRLGDIELPDPVIEPTIAAPATAATVPDPDPDPDPVQEIVENRVPQSNAFVTQALDSLQVSVAGLFNANISTSDESNHWAWLGLAGLAASLLLLLSAIPGMVNVAGTLKTRPELVTNPSSEAPSSETLSSETDSHGAISLREADQLIEDIEEVAAGNTTHNITVPDIGHAKVLAESANPASGVMRNLVGAARSVTGQLNGVVQKQEQHGRLLAEYDIRRQTAIAELSDNIGERAALLDNQHALLVSSSDLINEIDNRSATAVNGVNQVSASLATVSAQVEVSSERMQRLLQAAGSVTQATAKLKQLTEQTRLQALNISLKIPQAINEPVTKRANGYSDQHDASDRDDVTGLFDGIHQLTGKLVQIANETDMLVGVLQKDIDATAEELKYSSTEINESARHTLSTSLIGKELASYSDQLQELINQVSHQLEEQRGELSQTAERIVRLDRSGNEYSELTQTLTQDLAGLQAMSATLEDSIRDKQRGEVPLE